MTLCCSVFRFDETGGAIYGSETPEQFADLAPSGFHGSLGSLLKQLLQVDEHQLDRVQASAVRRQEQEVAAYGSDCLTYGLAFVAAEVVEHDDVSSGQRRTRTCST